MRTETIIKELSKRGVKLNIDGKQYPLTNCTRCIGELLKYTPEDKYLEVTQRSTRDSLVGCVEIWYDFKLIPESNPLRGLLRHYFAGRYYDVISDWLYASKLWVEPEFYGVRKLAIDCYDDLLHLVVYAHEEAIKRLAEHLLFYTDSDSFNGIGTSCSLECWLDTISRGGYLRFKPYIYEDRGVYSLPIKYNRVLTFCDHRFCLANGTSTYAYSGQLPDFSVLKEYGENFAVCMYYLAALSVAINCTDFITDDNLCVLEEYIQRVCSVSVEILPMLRCVMSVCDNQHVTSGYRISKEYAWDYVRYAVRPSMATVVVELPDVMREKTFSFDLSRFPGDAVECGAMVEKMLSVNDSNAFNLVSGILALFGIILNDKVARPVNKDVYMPALFPSRFKVVERL